VDDFNASQTHIFVRKLTISEVDRKLMLATAGGNPPDVAGLWTSSVVNFAEKNALLPLDRMLAEAGIGRTNYIPVFWDLCSHRGFVWALPSTPATTALHWNKALFREAVSIPTGRRVRWRNWTPWPSGSRWWNSPHRRHGACALHGVDTAREGGQGVPSCAGRPPAARTGMVAGPLAVLVRRPVVDGDRHLTADSPENVRAFTWFREQAEKYGVENLRTFGASFGNFSSPQNPSSRAASAWRCRASGCTTLSTPMRRISSGARRRSRRSIPSACPTSPWPRAMCWSSRAVRGTCARRSPSCATSTRPVRSRSSTGCN